MPKSKVRKKGGGTRAKPAPAVRSSLRHAFAAPGRDALPPLVFPADLLGMDAPEHARLGIDLVVADENRSELFRVAFDLTRRVRTSAGFEMWGLDRDGTISVHLVSRDSERIALDLRIAAEDVTGVQYEHLLDLDLALAPPNHLGLAVPGREVSAWSPLAVAWTSAPPPPGLLQVVRAHADIERALGVALPVTSYSGTDVGSTLETAAMLRGEAVENEWTTFAWDMRLPDAHDLVRGTFGDGVAADVEHQQPWWWRIGDDAVEVGTVLVRFASVRLDLPRPLPELREDNRDQWVTLRFVPGEDATMTTRLVEVAPREVDVWEPEPDQRWFWTPDWQRREREVDEHVAAGRVETFDGSDDFLAHVERVASDG